jgi:hypothetical protein
VDNRGVIGKDSRRPFQERQWRERLEIRGIPIEVDVVGRHVRHQPSAASLRTAGAAINPRA